MPTMDGNDPVDSRQANASTREVTDRMQALKNAKQLICISHIKSSAIVTHVKCSLFYMVFLTELDDRLFLFGCEFPGIAQQIFQYDMHKMWISFHHQIWHDRKCDSSIRLAFLQGLYNFFSHFAQVDEPRLYSRARDAG